MNRFVIFSLALLLHSGSFMHAMQAEKCLTEADVQQSHFEIFCCEDTWLKYDKNHVIAYIKNPENDINQKFSSGHIPKGVAPIEGVMVSRYPQPCLYRACMNDELGIVQALLSRTDVMVDECSDDCRTPLIRACFESSPQIIQLLLGAGADINYVDRCGHTPLYVACSHGRGPIVKILLAHKDITVHKTFWSPIFTTLSVLTAFFESGRININSKNENNQTVFYNAWCRDLLHVRKVLEDGQNIKAFMPIAHYDDVQKKKFLEDELHALAQVYEVLGDNNYTAGFIEFCIKEGADLNQRNDNGDRPLDVAVRKYNKLAKLVGPASKDLWAKEEMMHHFFRYTPHITANDLYSLLKIRIPIGELCSVPQQEAIVCLIVRYYLPDSIELDVAYADHNYSYKWPSDRKKLFREIRLQSLLQEWAG